MAAYQVREDDLPRKFSEAEGALAQLRREARVLAKAAKTQGDLRTAASLSLMDANADLAAATFELIATYLNEPAYARYRKLRWKAIRAR